MRRLLRSLSFRLALTYAVLFTLSVALLLGSYYLVTVRFPLERTEEKVRIEADELYDLYRNKGQASLVNRLIQRDAAPDREKAFHALIDPKGMVVTANLPSWPKAVAPSWLRIEADLFVDGDEHDFEALVLDKVFPDGERLIVGRDIENITEVENALASAAYAMVGIALLLGIAGGALMSRAIGRRIDTITRTARLVMTGDMSERIPLQGSSDDFDHLADTLNLMLSKIEGAVESVRRVSDSVAHELRTPLARLRADLEDLTNAPPGGHERLLANAIEEAGRLEKIFEAVLRISRIEARRHDTALRTIDLSALMNDAVEFFQPAAEARGIVLGSDVARGLSVRADPDLSFQALVNLLDNAIKYTWPGGHIHLSASDEGKGGEGKGIVMTLIDDGPGIAAEYRAHVTERFFRVPSTASQPGVGLGLSLVSAVVAFHGWQMELSDAGPGLKVTWHIDEIPSSSVGR